MKGDPVPDSDHMSRYCKGTCIDNGRINGTAFYLRSGEDLSVNWLEFTQCPDRDEQIKEIRKTLGGRLTLGNSAKIAVLNVGDLKENVYLNSEDNRELDVKHDPIFEPPPDHSHSEIYNLRPDYDVIADLLAEIIQEDYPAK